MSLPLSPLFCRYSTDGRRHGSSTPCGLFTNVWVRWEHVLVWGLAIQRLWELLTAGCSVHRFPLILSAIDLSTISKVRRLYVLRRVRTNRAGTHRQQCIPVSLVRMCPIDNIGIYHIPTWSYIRTRAITHTHTNYIMYYLYMRWIELVNIVNLMMAWRSAINIVYVLLQGMRKVILSFSRILIWERSSEGIFYFIFIRKRHVNASTLQLLSAMHRR